MVEYHFDQYLVHVCVCVCLCMGVYVCVFKETFEESVRINNAGDINVSVPKL